jgi:hypothetical protein
MKLFTYNLYCSISFQPISPNHTFDKIQQEMYSDVAFYSADQIICYNTGCNLQQMQVMRLNFNWHKHILIKYAII